MRTGWDRFGQFNLAVGSVGQLKAEARALIGASNRKIAG
jgi:hypothetical protein